MFSHSYENNFSLFHYKLGIKLNEEYYGWIFINCLPQKNTMRPPLGNVRRACGTPFWLGSLIDIMWPIIQITIPCVSFVLIEVKLIHCYFFVMFIIMSMSIYNDFVKKNEIIIH